MAHPVAQVLHLQSLSAQAPYNETHWKDKAWNDLLFKAIGQTDATAAQDAWNQVQNVQPVHALGLELDRPEGMAMVYVSHDLAVVARMADRIVVMYAGRVVENRPVDEVVTTHRSVPSARTPTPRP